MDFIRNSHGIEIFRSDDKYFLRYDAGGLVYKTKEIEISEKEAMEIQIITTEQGLYDYLINILNERMCRDG